MLFRYLPLFLLVFMCFEVSAKEVSVETDDFSLKGLISKALSHHPSIQSSVYSVASAEKAVEVAKWQHFPTPYASFDSNLGADTLIKFGFTQVLWSGGALDASLDRTRAELGVSQSSKFVAMEDLALKMINSYSTWYGSYLKRQAFLKSQQEYELLKKRIERRIEKELSPDIELALVNGRLLRAKAGLNAATIRYQSSLMYLEELTGETLDEDILIDSFLGNYVITGSKDVLLEKTVNNSLQLEKLLADIKVVEATYRERKSNLSPRVVLKAERQFNNFSTPNAKQVSHLFIDFSSSFGAGFSLAAQIEQIELEQQAASLNYKNQLYSTKQQFEIDWATYESLTAQRALLVSALLSVKKIQDSWYRQFLSGRKEWKEVMGSILEVSQLESQISDTIYESLLVSWRLGMKIEGVRALFPLENE